MKSRGLVGGVVALVAAASAASCGGSGGHTLGSTIDPAPEGFALSTSSDVQNGPIGTAGFDKLLNQTGAAAHLHFLKGYQVTYDSTSGNDSVNVTLFEFVSPADATAFVEVFAPILGRATPDPSIHGTFDVDSLTANPDKSYDHGAIGAKDSFVYSVDYVDFSASKVPLAETMARQQYAMLP
jgi:hypothetical protein